MMRHDRTPRIPLCCLVLVALLAAQFDGVRESQAADPASTPTFAITLDRQIAENALATTGERQITGRLYLFTSTRGGFPMRGPDWFQPEPFFRVDVSNVGPGDTMRLDGATVGFPDTLGKLPPGSYHLQAVLDHDFYCQHQARGIGNFYSTPQEITIGAAADSVAIALNKVVEAEPFSREAWLHEIVRPSKLLGEFFGREVVEHATVVLPEGYDRQPERRYPVIYEIPGFGGTHRPRRRDREAPPRAEDGDTEFIRVLLSGNCKWGHHVYADSATNGPRGAALVREMIPHIDATFRTIPESTARFVTGHSSGGWSSLWLQVTYPELFGGCWSTSPDPVDLRDFQQVNLYAEPPLSLYYDEQGAKRPIARRGTEPFLWFPDFGKMDDVLERGGQLRSFEAVFSPLGADGLPQRLWNRDTGRIDPAVAQSWQKYDIRLILTNNWATLGPRLAGKLHIITGELDTFYLEGAVRKLAAELRNLNSDAEIEIIPGRNHSDILTEELADRIAREMSVKYRAAHPH